MSASSEYIALCRSQLGLLTQALGASLSAVYLTEEFVAVGTAQAKLIPLVVYPETTTVWQEWNLALPARLSESLETPRKLEDGQTLPQVDAEAVLENITPSQQTDSLLPTAQIVLPLIHEDVMMGLLVTAREDRPWSVQEQGEIERVAQTLALGCIVDQRRAWLEAQLHQQQVLQAKQRDLLANLLHQFRNPLTAMRTFGKLLLKRLLPGDVNRNVADSIVRESDRLQELLQQFDAAIDMTVPTMPLQLPSSQVLLTTADADVSKPVLLLPEAESEGNCCYVADVLEPLVVSAQAIAQERNLQLQMQIPPQLGAIQVNAKVLREVLNNLIDNALKYTPAGGSVYIQAGRKQGGLQGVAISDTGPGIPPQDLEHLFERHYRGVQAQTAIPGTGLGLAIAKQLIEQMHGTIEVKTPAEISTKHSSAPGTTFIVWLPEVRE